MDNFDLKQYLANNPLLEERATQLWKITSPDGSSYLRRIDPEASSLRGKETIQPIDALKYVAKDTANASTLQLGITSANLGDFTAEKVGEGTKEEMMQLQNKLKGGDNVINQRIGGKGDMAVIRIPKAESFPSPDGKIFIRALYLQQNPQLYKDLKPFLDSTTTTHPTKGASFGINRKNIERV